VCLDGARSWLANHRRTDDCPFLTEGQSTEGIRPFTLLIRSGPKLALPHNHFACGFDELYVNVQRVTTETSQLHIIDNAKGRAHGIARRPEKLRCPPAQLFDGNGLL
jgi:hypothetical protein